MNAVRQVLQQIQTRRLAQAVQPYRTENLARCAIVFAPHQDDETLGCGGTVLHKLAAGASVQVVYMTDGSGSNCHLLDDPQTLIPIREQEAIAATQVLGIPATDVTFLRFPDGELRSHQQPAVERVAEILQRVQPEEIFMPYYREPMIIPDHVYTNQIVRTALNQLGLKATVYEYPVWFWYHYPWVRLNADLTTQRSKLSAIKAGLKSSWRALRMGSRLTADLNCGMDVSTVLEHKRKALYQHTSQMTQFIPDPRWMTVADVSDGEFLERLLQPQEVFYRWS